MNNWYYEYFFNDELEIAKSQIEFYENRKEFIQKKKDMSITDKIDKLKKIDFTITCIKYSYNL